jgi:hypothetical protein
LILRIYLIVSRPIEFSKKSPEIGRTGKPMKTRDFPASEFTSGDGGRRKTTDAFLDLPPADQVALAVAIGAAYRRGRMDALALDPETGKAERAAWRNFTICRYALERYSDLSTRGKAEAIARDMLRHPATKAALGGEALSADRIRKILSGRW